MESILLGAIQGITEFLPISSSAHLLIMSWILDGKTLPLSLNVALHVGTLTAVVAYFWRDWRRLILVALRICLGRAVDANDRRLLICLILGSIPAGVIGLLFHKQIEAVFHQTPFTTVAPLALFGLLLWWVDKRAPSKLTVLDVNWRHALIVGFAQAVALIPGSSRSGMTMTAGRWLGFQRGEAARFSFLLGTPAMGGAALLESRSIAASIDDPVFYLGFSSSLIVGLLTISFLLRYVRRFGFLAFAVYRVILAGILFMTL